ncbi:phosphatase PAP2 family protein [Microbacterium sp. NPDC077644]|uniref:phosphatase PAP2 family protein n=1 Tax=Microbacterium sp. NPDC077644 TaxID=3155055 RepID=UPI00344B836D
MMRPVLLWWGSGALVVAVVLGVFVTWGGVGATAADVAWNTLMGDIRTPVLLDVAHVLDRLGGGWVAKYLIPLVVIAALLLARRWRAAVFAAATMLISVAVVQLLKSVFGRARPEDMLVLSDYGSFPSGHTANAATLATLAVVLFPRLWVLIVAVAWTLAMALSRTLVSVHWLSDTVGGMLVGVGVTLVLAGFALTWARSRGREPNLPGREPPR